MGSRRLRPRRRFPALSLVPRALPAHAVSRVADPQRRMAMPISAQMAQAVGVLTPGILLFYDVYGSYTYCLPLSRFR